MTDIINQAKASLKAIVALATPIITVLIVDAAADLETAVIGWIAAAATAVTVWIAPNK